MVQAAMLAKGSPHQSISSSSVLCDDDKVCRTSMNVVRCSTVKGSNSSPDAEVEYSRPCSSVARTAIVGCGACAPADTMSGG